VFDVIEIPGKLEVEPELRLHTQQSLQSKRGVRGYPALAMYRSRHPLPLCQGDTLEEAREMAKDAILGYLEALEKDGVPIPDDTPLELEPVKEQIRVVLQTA
jgi:hypothetical protein